MIDSPIRTRPAAVIQQPGYVQTPDGMSLFYRDWGAGKPLLFLSGWTLNSLMWAYQMEPLSNEGLRCIAYDRRAHGRSTDPATPYQTVFQIRGLSPVVVTNQTTGYQYTEDGIGGASLLAVDTASNQVLATIGTLPVSAATALSGTFRGSADTGFLEASNPVSTQDPATRDLYLLNSQTPNSLVRVIGNL